MSTLSSLPLTSSLRIISNPIITLKLFRAAVDSNVVSYVLCSAVEPSVSLRILLKRTQIILIKFLLYFPVFKFYMCNFYSHNVGTHAQWPLDLICLR